MAERLTADDVIITLVGASGVGKSSVAESLHGAELIEPTQTWTTRELRPGEVEKPHDHRFVSDAEFDGLAADGHFVAAAPFYNARYAIPFLERPESGRVPLIILKPIFIPSFLEHYPAARVYHIDASPTVLPQRMRARGQSEADIQDRMNRHAEEVAASERFAHVTFQNDGPLNEVVAAVTAQIVTDRF